MTFRPEDGLALNLRPGDLQLRNVDHAWASTVFRFRGRTIDNVIVAMEADHAKLTMQKSFYIEISRARNRIELATDDRESLRGTLEAVTGQAYRCAGAGRKGEGQGQGLGD